MGSDWRLRGPAQCCCSDEAFANPCPAATTTHQHCLCTQILPANGVSLVPGLPPTGLETLKGKSSISYLCTPGVPRPELDTQEVLQHLSSGHCFCTPQAFLLVSWPQLTRRTYQESNLYWAHPWLWDPRRSEPLSISSPACQASHGAHHPSSCYKLKPVMVVPAKAPVPQRSRT